MTEHTILLKLEFERDVTRPRSACVAHSRERSAALHESLSESMTYPLTDHVSLQTQPSRALGVTLEPTTTEPCSPVKTPEAPQ
jgi:hypothetical protein